MPCSRRAAAKAASVAIAFVFASALTLTLSVASAEAGSVAVQAAVVSATSAVIAIPIESQFEVCPTAFRQIEKRQGLLSAQALEAAPLPPLAVLVPVRVVFDQATVAQLLQGLARHEWNRKQPRQSDRPRPVRSHR